MTVSSNVIMISIWIHLGLFSVALCLTGNNTCNDKTSRCVYLFIYLFIYLFYLFIYLRNKSHKPRDNLLTKIMLHL